MSNAIPNLYSKLEATTRAHLASVLPQTPGSNHFSPAAVRACFAPDFHMDWGHRHFVSTKPGLQGERSGDGFVTHMSSMTPGLKTWRIEITDLCVDVEHRSVVVRADYYMTPGVGEAVVNDIVLWMSMDESGEKIVRCTEFLDPVATEELGRRMRAAKGDVV